MRRRRVFSVESLVLLVQSPDSAATARIFSTVAQSGPLTIAMSCSRESFRTVCVAGLSDKRHQDERRGRLSAQAPDRIADLGRGGILDIAKADQCGTFGIEAEDARHRQGIGLLSACADSLPLDKLCDDERHGFVEQPAAWNAEDRFSAPAIGAASRVRAGRAVSALAISESGVCTASISAGTSACILMRARRSSTISVRIADAQHVFVADQSPVRVRLGEFEAFDEHFVVVRDKRFFLEDGLPPVRRPRPGHAPACADRPVRPASMQAGRPASRREI